MQCLLTFDRILYFIMYLSTSLDLLALLLLGRAAYSLFFSGQVEASTAYYPGTLTP